jgi:hypothetical protein
VVVTGRGPGPSSAPFHRSAGTVGAEDDEDAGEEVADDVDDEDVPASVAGENVEVHGGVLRGPAVGCGGVGEPCQESAHAEGGGAHENLRSSD